MYFSLLSIFFTANFRLLNLTFSPSSRAFLSFFLRFIKYAIYALFGIGEYGIQALVEGASEACTDWDAFVLYGIFLDPFSIFFSFLTSSVFLFAFILFFYSIFAYFYSRIFLRIFVDSMYLFQFSSSCCFSNFYLSWTIHFFVRLEGHMLLIILSFLDW